MDEIEATCRRALRKATAREYAVSQVAPEHPSADYATGFAAGELSGQASLAAIVLGIITDESPIKLLDEARAQAAVETAFPFDLHIEPMIEDVP